MEFNDICALRYARKAGRAFEAAHQAIRGARRFSGDPIFVTRMVKMARRMNRTGVSYMGHARNLLATLVKPCDGHSCDAEVTHGTR